MKLELLEEGNIYKCKLSGREMLVLESTKTLPSEKDGGKDEVSKVKVGKFSVEKPDGSITFVYDELYDGQLEEIK